MLPVHTSNCVDNIVPDIPFCESAPSSYNVHNDDQHNFMCERLREIRAKNINKVIDAELNINSI